jgi:hypothetical protein
MKLLLDESVPRSLGTAFPDHFEIQTVQQAGWAGTKNGELPSLIREHDYSPLITADKGIAHQQIEPERGKVNPVEISVHGITLPSPILGLKPMNYLADYPFPVSSNRTATPLATGLIRCMLLLNTEIAGLAPIWSRQQKLRLENRQ